MGYNAHSMVSFESAVISKFINNGRLSIRLSIRQFAHRSNGSLSNQSSVKIFRRTPFALFVWIVSADVSLVHFSFARIRCFNQSNGEGN